jgi:hypothetical protein
MEASLIRSPAVLCSMQGTNKTELRKISGGVLALSAIVMAAEWILLVAGVKRDEMIVGAICVVAAALFLQLVYRAEDQRLEIRLKDLIQAWRIPWYILTGSWEITLILFKDLTGIERANSFYRVGGFKTSKYDPLLVARRVLATAFTTTAPNFIIVGIDYEQSRMLFHQLERSSVPKMTQALGALSGGTQRGKS